MTSTTAPSVALTGDSQLPFIRRWRIWIAAVTGIAGGLWVPIIGSVSPLMAVAVWGGIALTWFTIVYPSLSVLLTALVVPVERMGRFSNDSQAITISLMRLFGLLGLLSLAVNWVFLRRKVQLYRPVLVYGLYVAFCFLSLTWGTEERKGLSSAITMLGNFLFMVIVTNVIRSPRQLKLPIVLWICSTIAISLFTIYQWSQPSSIVQVDRFNNSGERTTDERFSTVMEDYAEFEQIGAVKRAIGATSHPAVYGINIILTIPFTFYLLRVSSGFWMWLLCVANLSLGAYNALLTNTRAVLVTLVFALGVSVLSGLIKLRLSVIAGAFACGLLALPLLPETLFNRIFDASNYSTEKAAAMRIRMTYWETGVDIFADHWLLGLGVGNQTELVRRLEHKMPMPSNTSIHNEYFQTLIETGILGFPLMVAFMVLLYRRLKLAEHHFRRTNDPGTRWFVNAAKVCFITVLFYALQCDVLHFTLKGWWLAMGLVVSMSELALLQQRQAWQQANGNGSPANSISEEAAY